MADVFHFTSILRKHPPSRDNSEWLKLDALNHLISYEDSGSPNFLGHSKKLNSAPYESILIDTFENSQYTTMGT